MLLSDEEGSSANPNKLTGDDIPIFVAMFINALKMDSVTNNIRIEDEKKVSSFFSILL